MKVCSMCIKTHISRLCVSLLARDRVLLVQIYCFHTMMISLNKICLQLTLPLDLQMKYYRIAVRRINGISRTHN